MAPRKAEVLAAVRTAIRESTNAPQAGHSKGNIFVKTYGPGLQGITPHVKKGEFLIHASRFRQNTTHETVIVVNLIPDSTRRPDTPEQLDATTRSITEEVEAEFHKAGATLYHEGHDTDRTKKPWRWYMIWVWDKRS